MNACKLISEDGSHFYQSEESTFVAAAKAGEWDAITELMARHRGRILAVATRITNNHADAEDVFQTTCLQVLMHVSQFDGRSMFSTWVTRIAINSSLMVLRRNRSASNISMEELTANDSARLKDLKADTWAEVFDHELTSHVETAIGRLQPRLRAVMLVQRRHQGSIKQTAELAGLSVAATKSRLFRARRELRRHLQKYV
jgi:RNA polymerase sigma factor (sigma-70 family)